MIELVLARRNPIAAFRSGSGSGAHQPVTFSPLQRIVPLRRASVGTQAKIVELLVEKYGVDAERASEDATMADLGLDSLSVAELVFDIEDLFELVIDTADAEFSTLGEAAALVDRLIEAKGA